MHNTFDDWSGQSLQHYGVLGMKWGQRRYQNPDGTLTPAGQRHYAETGERGYQYHSHATKKYQRKAAKQEQKLAKARNRYIDAMFDHGLTSNKAEKANHDQIKAAVKKEKYERRAQRSAELDRREQAAAEKAKTGRSILTRMLINPDVTKAYHQYNAMSGGKPGKATKIVNGIFAAYGGTFGSRLYKAAYLRQGEKAAGKGFANRASEYKQGLDASLAKADKAVDAEIKRKRRQYNI